MKKIVLIANLFLLTLSLSAQFVVVNSPADLQGAYAFTGGYSSTADWLIDLNSNVWTGDCVLVQDATANPSQGCEALVNGADIAGKIALIDRGTCSFTQKFCHAQDAGAIAVVILNSAANAGLGPGPLGYTAGICTPAIPIVHLSYEDGVAIKAALANGPVNMTIGNIVFANNVGSSDREGIFHAPIGVIPASQIEDIRIVPGASVTNSGSETATNVAVGATINYTPFGGTAEEIYNASATTQLIEPDSSVVITLDDYQLTDDQGAYKINYTISSDAIDEVPFDNTFDSEFFVTENVYCKGGWDLANNRPKITQSYTISGGGNIEFLAPFTFPNGTGLRADSIRFYVSSAVNLQGANIAVYLYKWDDLNADLTSTNDEISIVGLQTVTISDSLTSAWITSEIVNFSTFENGYDITDGEVLMVGVRYQGANLVYFGFDEDMDYTQYLNYLTAQGTTISDAQLPYIGINAWQGTPEMPDVSTGFLFSGNRSAVATALILGESTVNTQNIADASIDLNIYPNPVSNILTSEVDMQEMAENVEYRIVDAQGRLVKSIQKNDVREDRVVFNVAGLAAGNYFFVVKTNKGTVSRSFTVSH